MFQQNLFHPISPPDPPSIGYKLTADNPDKSKEFATFMMARTIEEAFERCIEYFPLEEGFIHLEVKSLVDSKYRDIEQITRILMPDEYIGENGKLSPAKHGINLERQSELKIHIPNCDICLQDCPECWEFYSNQGHDEYVQVLTSNMKGN